DPPTRELQVQVNNPPRRVSMGIAWCPGVSLEVPEGGLGLLGHHLRRPRRAEDHLRLHRGHAGHVLQEGLHLVLDQRSDRAAHRGQGVLDGDRAPLADLDVVHQAEVDDVHAQLGVHDVLEGLADRLLGGRAAIRCALGRGVLLVLGLPGALVGAGLVPGGLVHERSFLRRRSASILRDDPKEDPLTAESQPKPRGGGPLRILIVDDHPVTREGLHAALDLANDVVVVGESDSGEDAVVKVGELTPDIVFMDVRMPGMNGIEATKAIRQASPSTRVILFTVDESRASISEAIQAGVSGYLLKDASADELVNAARLALEGKAVIHPQLTRAFIEEVQIAEKRVEAPPLSRREKETLQKVAYGATTKEVAHDLGISPHTVKTPLERIFEKLGANDR